MGQCELDAGSTDGSADEGSGSMWVLGVVLSVVSSVVSNLGVNTQKLSLMREAKRKKGAPDRSYFRQPLWLVGLLMVFTGSLGDFAALGFAAQSLVTPVGAVTMVANLFFASMWLGETLSGKDMVGTVLILIGAVLAGAFADKSDQCYTLDELVNLYAEPAFVVYVLAVLGVCALFYGISRRCERVRAEHGVHSAQYAKLTKIHPFCYSLLSGTTGAQSVLFAKSTAELLEISFGGDVQFHRPVSWLILALMLCSIFLQLHFMARGLQHFDALYIVPVFQCFFITVAILGGGVYFGELSRFSTLQSIMFPLGVLFTIGGVGILSTHQMSSDGDGPGGSARVHAPVPVPPPAMLTPPPPRQRRTCARALRPFWRPF
jgi:drug/metabolite transporter (DMT)-like permease|eukprot:COSAG01_NODE_2096_length_8434_cov_840.500660_1_plen_375_part_00